VPSDRIGIGQDTKGRGHRISMAIRCSPATLLGPSHAIKSVRGGLAPRRHAALS
jgi:hypothetical protein